MRILALLLLFCAGAHAASLEDDAGPEEWNPPARFVTADSGLLCVAIDRFGCWYAPPTIRNANAPTLLVFFRGWRNDRERSKVPAEQRVDSSRQAFSLFDLDRLAREKNLAVLITGAPPLAVSRSLVQNIQSALGLTFARVVLASHSAGYEGLDSTLTLETFPRIQRIVMLDNFYMEGSLLDSVNSLVRSGTACNGFYTYDSRDSIQRHQAAFARICRLEDHDDTGHFDTINKCLGNYIEGQDCP